MSEKQHTSVTIGNIEYKVSLSFRHRGQHLLILLHGLGGSKTNFSALWDSEAFKDISLLSFDFLGFGHSDKPEEFSYTMEDQAEVCNQILESYDGYHWHLAVHSMGGAIGLLLSGDVLKNVVSFANLEGNLIDKDCFLSRKVMEMPYDRFTEELLPKMKSKSADNKVFLSDLNLASPKAYYLSCKSLVKWSDSGELLERFNKLSQAKAYFFGERNADIEPLKLLKDIDKIQIDESGHVMMLDNPKDFSDKLKRFLPLD